LIAPDVFLTASHCTVYFEQNLAPAGYTAFVSFDNPIPFGDLTSKSTKLVAVTQVVSNPGYNQAQSDSGDIAVLLVDSRQTRGITPAVLPAAGLLDQLAAQNGLKNSVFTAAGYGVQNRVTGGGTPFFQDLNPVPRMYSFSSFDSLNGGYIRLSQNPSTGNGGTCFGDSGGPNFLNVDGTRTLVAITITGDSVCRSTNVDLRLDTESARAFLAPYVSLP
jgi:secreted trypsin-like serine protease